MRSPSDVRDVTPADVKTAEITDWRTASRPVMSTEEPPHGERTPSLSQMEASTPDERTPSLSQMEASTPGERTPSLSQMEASTPDERTPSLDKMETATPGERTPPLSQMEAYTPGERTPSLDQMEAATPSKAPKPAALLGYRHLQAGTMMLGVVFAYAMRSNLNIAIVAMTDSAGANPNFPEYNWTESQKSVVLSSFFWGYVAMQLPAGPLALYVGAARLLTISLLGASLFTMLTPPACAWGGWQLLCALRVIQGLSQGVMFPCTHTLLARWIPKEERDTICNFVYSGGLLGTVLAMSICGVLSTSSLGWPADYYVFGVAGLAATALWFFFGAESPATHARISAAERDYIRDGTGAVDAELKSRTPWLAIVTSLPVWANLLGGVGFGWTYATLLSEIPSYMNSVLGYNLKANGFLSSLPYIAMFLMSYVYASLSAFLHRRKLLSLTNCRKLFQSIATWGPLPILVGLTYSSDPAVSVALLTVTVGLSGAFYVGYNINMIDLAPRLAGTLMGFGNGLVSVMSVITPLVVGAIVTDPSNVHQWRTVFFVAAGIGLVANAVFVAFASADQQPWDSAPPKADGKAETTPADAKAETTPADDHLETTAQTNHT